MITPSVPNSKMVMPDGYVSNEWRVFFTQMVNEQQSRLSQEGYVTPTQSNADIQLLNIPKYTGGILYDSDSSAGRINMDSTYNLLSSYQKLTTAEINAIPLGKRDSKFFHDTTINELKIGFNDQIKTVTLT